MVTNGHGEEEGNGVARDWWARTAIGLGGALCGMCVAWFTAYTQRGVSRSELDATVTKMENYVSHYSPYALDKSAIDEQQRTQNERLAKIEAYIEQERKP